ncbi:MAG: tRNA ((37)-N6)-dimethylallyltransferase MiaA, partial [Rhodospirillales bacterium]|nr:tRNA ((37)-N6)-dimethylallyltransferase MiaA [Rhodospirillales bacterium]
MDPSPSATSAPIIIIGGPTASGKSALALAIAHEFGGTIINADSMQVYRDLKILTARPDAALEALVPHRLYGVLDTTEPCSAARWAALAEEAIAAASAAASVPILVGGTGLYFRALLDGLAAVPPIPPEIRVAVRQRHAELGGAAFRELLAERDPLGAARLAAGDTQRLIRAYEVVTATGRTLGAWQDEQAAAPRRRHAAFVLVPPRETLYAACDDRFAAMMAAGALAEARALVGRNLDPGLPAMKALGIPELARHLAGEIPLDEAVTLAQQATRRYAKRQLTWFRHQLPEATAIEMKFSESLLPKIF